MGKIYSQKVMTKRTRGEDPDPISPRKKKRRKEPAETDISGFDRDKVESLQDLIALAEHLKATTKSRRRKTGVYRLINAIPELKELESVIGLTNLKDEIAKQITFFLLDLNDSEFMHTALFGDPGMGKTTVIEILGRLYSKLEFLSSGHVVHAGRADLVDQYLGGTALKTRSILELSRGGILCLDEIYALGDSQQRDSFSAECIHTINQFLSENSEDFICIIAGYEKQVKTNFFASNPGLERRFPWVFRLKPFSLVELIDVFKFQVEKQGWNLEDDIDNDFLLKELFKEQNQFKSNGGDTSILLDKAKVCHARRVFLLPINTRRKLTRDDLTNGYKMFLEYKNLHTTSIMTQNMMSMYC